MLNLSAATRVFVATAPVDLRESFNRLFALTQAVLQQDALSGHWFVFANRQRNRVKILFWDGSGLWVCAKRLESGTFHWPQSAGEPNAKLRLAPQALQLLHDGVDLKAGARRAWYESEN